MEYCTSKQELASLSGQTPCHNLSDLQDHFAAIAMQTTLAACHPESSIIDYDDIACRAYLMARAMMRRRAMIQAKAPEDHLK